MASVFLAQPLGKSNRPVFCLRLTMVRASCLPKGHCRGLVLRTPPMIRMGVTLVNEDPDQG
jgi:hypothetical protein